MKTKLNQLTAATIVGIFSVAASSQPSAEEMKAIEIPGGWELSATLALFRNLPLFEIGTIPETSGDVYFSRSEKSREEDGWKFTNTYRFFRQINGEDGKYVELSVVEEHHIAEMKSDPAVEPGKTTSYHRVSDVKHEMRIIDRLPGEAKVSKKMSRLLCYILDHLDVLVGSEMGALARKLNYQPAGRVRSPDYVQPGVSFLVDSSGKIDRVRIYGLDSMVRQSRNMVELGRDDTEHVLEMRVDESGNAQVTFAAIKAQ